MSVGTKVALRTNYRVGGPPKELALSKLQVQQLLDLPNFGGSEEVEAGNLAYDNGNIVYYDGTEWRVLTSGISGLSNAPDTDPNPNPQFVLNSTLQLRNFKTLGNGITLQTLSNTIAVNYEPNFTVTPSPNSIRPWVGGQYTAIYSNSLSITQDGDQNYSIEALGASILPNAPNSLSIPSSEIINENSNVRLLTGGDGIQTVEADPTTEYTKIIGYDQSLDFTTVDDTPFAISIPLPLGESKYYNIKIRGHNQTSDKLYYFEYTRGVKNISGTTSLQPSVANLIDTDGDSVVVNFTTGTNEFFVIATGLAGQTIAWKFLLRRV